MDSNFILGGLNHKRSVSPGLSSELSKRMRSPSDDEEEISDKFQKARRHDSPTSQSGFSQLTDNIHKLNIRHGSNSPPDSGKRIKLHDKSNSPKSFYPPSVQKYMNNKNKQKVTIEQTLQKLRIPSSSKAYKQQLENMKTLRAFQQSEIDTNIRFRKAYSDAHSFSGSSFSSGSPDGSLSPVNSNDQTDFVLAFEESSKTTEKNSRGRLGKKSAQAEFLEKYKEQIDLSKIEIDKNILQGPNPFTMTNDSEYIVKANVNTLNTSKKNSMHGAHGYARSLSPPSSATLFELATQGIEKMRKQQELTIDQFFQSSETNEVNPKPAQEKLPFPPIKPSNKTQKVNAPYGFTATVNPNVYVKTVPKDAKPASVVDDQLTIIQNLLLNKKPFGTTQPQQKEPMSLPSNFDFRVKPNPTIEPPLFQHIQPNNIPILDNPFLKTNIPSNATIPFGNQNFHNPFMNLSSQNLNLGSNDYSHLKHTINFPTMSQMPILEQQRSSDLFKGMSMQNPNQMVQNPFLNPKPFNPSLQSGGSHQLNLSQPKLDQTKYQQPSNQLFKPPLFSQYNQQSFKPIPNVIPQSANLYNNSFNQVPSYNQNIQTKKPSVIEDEFTLIIDDNPKKNIKPAETANNYYQPKNKLPTNEAEFVFDMVEGDHQIQNFRADYPFEQKHDEFEFQLQGDGDDIFNKGNEFDSLSNEEF